jgi:hypothetical protein
MNTTLAPYRFSFRHACRLRDRIMDAVAADGYEATLSEIVNTFYDPPHIKDPRAARLVHLIGAIYSKTELRDLVSSLHKYEVSDFRLRARLRRTTVALAEVVRRTP